MASYLSTKAIPASERLIFALDVPGTDEAIRLVATLGEAVSFYKVGLDLFMAGGYIVMDRLADQGKKVMVDLKLFDVPETVRLAVRQLAKRSPAFATVHGNDAILAAAAGQKGSVQILAVTVLTSLDRGDLADLCQSPGPVARPARLGARRRRQEQEGKPLNGRGHG